MSEYNTELTKMQILRLSNEESNRITRECIESAFIFLLKKKSFSEVTITDIVKKAGVSRTAYYRNYASKEDILQNLVSDIVKKITVSLTHHDPYIDIYDFWLTMFNSAKSYSDVLVILFNANMGEVVLENVNKMLIVNKKLVGIEEQYTQLFWNSAAFGLLFHWIINGMKQTPEKMAEIICNAVMRLKK